MSELKSSIDPVTENDDKGSNVSAEQSPLAKLAQTLRKRALDLIAIGIVIAATLTLGRQMAAWWNTDPDAVNQFSESARLLASADRMWTDASQPVSVEFGGVPYHMQREKVTGDEQQVVERLISRAFDHSMSNQPLKQTHSSYVRLLKAIESEKPVKSEKNVEVFVLRGPTLIVVGTRKASESNRDVVCWGLYYPSEQNEWTTWLFSRSSDSGEIQEHQPHGGKLDALLPSNSKIIMALRTTYGTGILNFRSTETLSQCQIHFDTVLENKGWKSIQGWERRENLVLNSYEIDGQRGKTKDISSRHRGLIVGRIDLQFSESDGEVAGVIYRVSQISNQK